VLPFTNGVRYELNEAGLIQAVSVKLDARLRPLVPGMVTLPLEPSKLSAPLPTLPGTRVTPAPLNVPV